MTLEEYRVAVIDAIAADGDEYLRIARVWLHGWHVTGVWIHGSVLDPENFNIHSDVDIVITVDVPNTPEGAMWEASDTLAGRFHDPISGGVLDVLVLNLPEPYGRAQKVA